MGCERPESRIQHRTTADVVQALGTVSEPVREPWHVSFREDLSRAAERIDAILENRPDIRKREWVRRLGKLRLSLADPDTGGLAPGPVSSRLTASSTSSA